VAESTITVTNLGDQDVQTVLGVIYPPQVALVGCFGQVVDLSAGLLSALLQDGGAESV